MKTSVRSPMQLFGMGLGLAAASALAGPRYGVTDLGVLEPSSSANSFSQGRAINDSSSLAGFATRLSTAEIRAVTAQPPTTPGLSQLTTLGGFHAQAFAINASGEMAGSSFIPGDFSYHATVWKGGEVVDLGTLGGSNRRALAISDTAEVAGAANLAGDTAEHAVLWTGTQRLDLGTLPGGGFSQANGVNATRQVTGYSSLANGQQHAFLWQGGVMTDLGTLGGSFSEGHAINDAGDVVGYSTTAADAAQHAVLWRSGAPPADLGTLGGTFSEAHAINGAGQIVGTANIRGDQVTRGFLWENGGIIDLNTLVPPGGTVIMEEANDISESGLIVGSGRVGAEFHAVLLTPDRTPPQIACPGNIAVASQPSGLGTPVVADDIDPAPLINNNAPISFADNAVTLVTWTATDGAGNQGHCVQTVTMGTPAPNASPISPPANPAPTDPPPPVSPPATPSDPASPSNPSTTSAAPTNPSTTPASVAVPVVPPSTEAVAGDARASASVANLQVEAGLKQTGRKVKLNAKLTYIFRITNVGSASANSVVFQDELSPRLRYRKVNASHGVCSTPGKAKAGGVVNCALGDLAPGQQAKLEIMVQARKRGNVVNHGFASSAAATDSSAALQIKVR